MNNDNLYKLNCTACSGNTPKLKIEEIYINLKKINKWKVNDEKKMIYKKIFFTNFKKALNFANSVGRISEKEGHHPDISIGWGYCLILIHTHAIKGLSINDFILAAKIDKISI